MILISEYKHQSSMGIDLVYILARYSYFCIDAENRTDNQDRLETVSVVSPSAVFIRHSLTIIVTRNGIKDPRSNPGRDSLHFTLCLEKGMNQYVLLAMSK